MRSGSHVKLAALRKRDLELQTTSPFSNHGSVERSKACFRHKKFYKNNDSLEGAQKEFRSFFQFRASWSGSLETRDKNLD